MNTLPSILKGTLILDQATFERLRDSRNAMKTGVIILLVAFLIATFPSFVGGFAGNVQPLTAEKAADVADEVRQGFQDWQQFMPSGDQFSQMFMDQFMQNFNAGINMAVQIDALPAPLPRVLARFFQSLGTWLSHPFNHLAAWLAYGIWVLLFAKLLGGVGGVDRFLGLTALYAIPNLLGFFSFVPFVGWLVALVGTIWGWAVYIRGVQVSQRFDLGKAILAAVLPLLILILLVVVVTFLGVLGLVAAANGSG